MSASSTALATRRQGLVEHTLQHSVPSTIVSLHGFPASRAAKYLRQKVFKFNPDYIVIQFGATDASCSIRSRKHLTSGSAKSSGALGAAINHIATINHIHAATVFTLLRWEIASVLGFILKPQVHTTLSTYTAAIESMVDDCTSAGITPVVLPPFVFGSRYSTKNAILYTDALHEHIPESEI